MYLLNYCMNQSRQLAAIMFTDIVGYTSLMGSDSEKAKQFHKKYIAELKGNYDSLNEFKKIIKDQKTITLLYASKDSKPIHAIVLKQTLKD